MTSQWSHTPLKFDRVFVRFLSFLVRFRGEAIDVTMKAYSPLGSLDVVSARFHMKFIQKYCLFIGKLAL